MDNDLHNRILAGEKAFSDGADVLAILHGGRVGLWKGFTPLSPIAYTADWQDNATGSFEVIAPSDVESIHVLPPGWGGTTDDLDRIAKSPETLGYTPVQWADMQATVDSFAALIGAPSVTVKGAG